jgi:trehalose synthase
LGNGARESSWLAPRLAKEEHMLDQVPVTTRPLDAYRPLVGDAEIERIRTLAAPFAGARVLHLNATASGGGVAELLATLVPLMRAVGLDAEWRTLRCADGFFAVTKAMHNALQGADLPLTGEMRAVWERHTRENARDLEGSYDLIIVHDPQPAGIRAMLDRQSSGAWVWRCHIDLTTSDPAAWDFLRPYLTGYDAAVFSMPEYAKRDLTGPQIAVIPPSIDPLSPKNAALPHERVRAIVRDYGIDPDRPLLVQVSRFDPWKDPLGVIAAYRTVKRAIPDVQLALLGALATDDPEGREWHDEAVRTAGGDADIAILSNLDGISDVEVNAFQRAASVCIQKSLREGFGLTVAEALHKGRPVVAGDAGGIRAQIEDGVSGFLVRSVEECAQRCLQILRDPALGERLGQAGRARVRERFLSTAELRRHLELLRAVAAPAGADAKPVPSVAPSTGA